jgi:hypothetical protein
VDRVPLQQQADRELQAQYKDLMAVEVHLLTVAVAVVEALVQ